MDKYTELLSAVVTYIAEDSTPVEKKTAYLVFHRHIQNRAPMAYELIGPDWVEYDEYLASVEGDSSRGQS